MDSRPNILLFMTDHQRADSLFMEQCGREVTPNLNRLAREGMVFEPVSYTHLLAHET